MDEKLKIKISIADQSIHLTVDFIKKKGCSASKKIDIMMKQFEGKLCRSRQTRCFSHVLYNLPQVEQKQIDNTILGRNIGIKKN
jgi:hypothetical protein